MVWRIARIAKSVSIGMATAFVWAALWITAEARLVAFFHPMKPCPPRVLRQPPAGGFVAEVGVVECDEFTWTPDYLILPTTALVLVGTSLIAYRRSRPPSQS